MKTKAVRQIRPTRLYETVTQELGNPILSNYRTQEPPWYKVVNSIPPAEVLTRSIPPRLQQTNSKHRAPQKIFRPQRITYPEDRLRQIFYKDHPWELARPRLILELDGEDGRRCDWSKGPKQPGLPLSGECVVQRQLWLMENSNMAEDRAYDVARREFYALRQEEEIEKRVAREEARFVGAYFGKNKLQIGQDLEDAQFETWKKWASEKVVGLENARASAYAEYGEEVGGEAAAGEEEVDGLVEVDLAEAASAPLRT